MTFRGNINVENILEDICANLINLPKVCENFIKNENIEYSELIVQGESSVSGLVLVVVVLVLVLANVILIFAYRRCVKKEMDDTMGFKVSSAVSQYVSVAQLDRAAHSNNSLEMSQD